MKTKHYWVISLLAVLAVGPGLMSNTALSSVQGLVQKAVGTSVFTSVNPILIGNMAFALLVPVGPLLRKKFGARPVYLASLPVFILGSLLIACSSDVAWMAAGRFLQGAATGVMLMIMIPMLVLSFPIERRNYALLVLIGGFYGSVIIGTILGTIATSCGHWRWLFFIFGTLSLIGVAVSYFFLHDEHHGASDQEQPLDHAGILLSVFLAAASAVSFIFLQKWGLSSGYVWIGFGVTLCLLIGLLIVEYKVKNPFISIKLMLLPKPVLGLLIIAAGTITVAVSLSAFQGLLRQMYDISQEHLIFLNLTLLIGVAIAAILSALLYDKVGPGMLGIIGGLILVFVNFQWLHMQDRSSLYMFAALFIMLAAGTGLTVAAGLMGAAMGGPLPDLVKRMTAVQFLRLFVYMGVPILIGFFTKKDAARQSGSVQDSMMTAYHDLFFISFILSVLLVCLSFCMNATGMGHKLAHKPHDKAKAAPEKPAVSAEGLSKATVKSYKVINDTEYRNALRNLQK
ncbi:MFS transporter [Bacillus subtilis]|uniref:MFS transporter n=3 Tax=Bacillaceae TaxID=186817 RepID=UPI0005A4435E|nr:MULTISPECIES: MFS transporter [Bacillus]MBW4824810.1 MFS transporter [Bacillaceae bacterium]MUG02191.1 MFS transporter [Bacillus tequilensis]AJO59494.1 MFS transporter [Bacillus sp. YP1]ASC00691.1 MFS transporter [Bacillus subtilis]AXF34400.1 MFS transporter [Bacillus sp. DM2]